MCVCVCFHWEGKEEAFVFWEERESRVSGGKRREGRVEKVICTSCCCSLSFLILFDVMVING